MVDLPISPGVLALIQILGLPGLVFIIWYLDMQKFHKIEQKRDETRQTFIDVTNRTLQQYREDVAGIQRMYENNARLCDDYNASCKRLEKLYSETMSVISLNTQTMTRLCMQMDHFTKGN